MFKRLGLLTRLFISKNKSIAIFAVIAIFFIYEHYTFLRLYRSYNPNIYDFAIYIYSNKFNILYIFPITFTTLIINFAATSNFNPYVIVKYKNKKRYFREIILILFLISITFSIAMFILTLFIALPNLSIHNSWGDTINAMVGSYFPQMNLTQIAFDNIKSLFTPISFILISIALFTLYIFIISLIYFIVSIKSKNTFIIFFAANILGFVSKTIEVVSNNINIQKWLIDNNIIMFTHNFGVLGQEYLPSVTSSVIKLLVIIICLIYIGSRLFIHEDINWSVS